METSNHLAPPVPPTGGNRRRMSMRPGSGPPARRGGRRPSVGQGNAQVLHMFIQYALFFVPTCVSFIIIICSQCSQKFQ